MIAVYEKYLDIIWNDLSPPMRKRLEKHFKDIADEINRIKDADNGKEKRYYADIKITEQDKRDIKNK